MSWFSPRGSGPRKEQGRVQAEVEPDVHRSLALAALCEEIRRRKLTSAGPRLGRRLERRVPLPVRLQAVHRGPLRRPLRPRRRAARASSRVPASSPSSSPIPEETRFDVILAWDLFNYLQRKELAAFSEQLRPLHQPRRADLRADLLPQDHPGAALPLPDPGRAAPGLRAAHRRRAPLAAPRPGRGHQPPQGVPRRPLVPAASTGSRSICWCGSRARPGINARAGAGAPSPTRPGRPSPAP